jgi:hypothetical protein
VGTALRNKADGWSQRSGAQGPLNPHRGAKP